MQLSVSEAPVEPDEMPSGNNTLISPEVGEGSLLEMVEKLAARWRLLVLAPLASGALAVSGSYLIDPTYTAVTMLLPPQQQQTAAASALAGLGALSGLAGGLGGSIKTPGDQYVGLLQSANVENRAATGNSRPRTTTAITTRPPIHTDIAPR